MQKYEFEQLAEQEVSDRDYEIIETVYMWHPVIGDKKEAAELFKSFGITIFVDLLPRAKMCMIIEKQMRIKRGELKQLEEEYEDLRTGRTLIGSQEGNDKEDETDRGRDGTPHIGEGEG